MGEWVSSEIDQSLDRARMSVCRHGASCVRACVLALSGDVVRGGWFRNHHYATVAVAQWQRRATEGRNDLEIWKRPAPARVRPLRPLNTPAFQGRFRFQQNSGSRSGPQIVRPNLGRPRATDPCRLLTLTGPIRRTSMLATSNNCKILP